jgi:hypothetical protein
MNYSELFHGSNWVFNLFKNEENPIVCLRTFAVKARVSLQRWASVFRILTGKDLAHETPLMD